MKKSVSILIIIFNFIFTSCFTIPRYVDKDGNITPPYLTEYTIHNSDFSEKLVYCDNY